MSNGDRKNHYRALEGMYLSAPINEPLDIQVAIDDGHCEILLETTPQMWHAALAVHGSVFFKLLDDAAFFAAASKIPDAFVLTASFHLEFLRPLVEGQVRAVGDQGRKESAFRRCGGLRRKPKRNRGGAGDFRPQRNPALC
jgi:uncharacterized protein (TIGR00369 family)